MLGKVLGVVLNVGKGFFKRFFRSIAKNIQGFKGNDIKSGWYILLLNLMIEEVLEVLHVCWDLCVGWFLIETLGLGGKGNS